jgi:uncharacterized protein DUF4190
MNESPGITIKRGGEQFGPYSPEQVLTLCREKRLLATDLASVTGSDELAPLALVMKRLGQPFSAGLVDGDGMRYLAPVGRSGFAIAAGYLALFSVLLVPGPLALVCGLLGLRSIARRPELLGRGRAWFGIVAGGIATALLVFLLIVR